MCRSGPIRLPCCGGALGVPARDAAWAWPVVSVTQLPGAGRGVGHSEPVRVLV